MEPSPTVETDVCWVSWEAGGISRDCGLHDGMQKVKVMLTGLKNRLVLKGKGLLHSYLNRKYEMFHEHEKL